MFNVYSVQIHETNINTHKITIVMDSYITISRFSSASSVMLYQHMYKFMIQRLMWTGKKILIEQLAKITNSLLQ